MGRKKITSNLNGRTSQVVRRTLTALLAIGALAVSVSAHAWSKKDARIGKEIYDQTIAESAIYEEPRLVEYVNKVGHRIVAGSDRPDEEYVFTVIDSPDINAFATPGGYVYINRGLISYMTSEAQLAAVLAHEVGHITAKHAARQNRANTTSNIVSGILGVLTGSGDVAEASSLWGQTVVRGYGRDMELEADQLGARFLFNSGYPPSAMIEVISLLKDNENLEKRKARETGRKVQSYHGLFATHPRNDKRLLEVVAEAGKLSEGLDADANVTPFRIATNGLPWGTNFRAPPPRKNRVKDEKLKFQFDHPDGWQFIGKDKTYTGNDADQHYRMTIDVQARTRDTPRMYIKNKLGETLKKAEDFTQAKLNGSRGYVTTADGKQQRIAVIYHSRYAVVFRGDVLEGGDAKQGEEHFGKVIGSFRAISTRALAAGKTKTISYVKAKEGVTFRKLSQFLKLGQFGEQELRIINGYPSRGEPKPGEWIKIIR
ncbi:M48 family metalloprotease [Porticoccus sp. W117]|uniref:M48 family metalloprotease n=1 Tax=Porticoccus sp. W117 TaxID=3054777 RepID=UPI002596ADE0|nr:M48 family metalloprotease [Porticoccus sp. W117]MDM3870722.1 M48 family metalloprotease [Porticoccus sp. W117]